MANLVGSRVQALSAKAQSRGLLAPLAKPPSLSKHFLPPDILHSPPSPLLLPRSLAILKNVVPSQSALSKLPVIFPAIVSTPSTIILRSERFLLPGRLYWYRTVRRQQRTFISEREVIRTIWRAPHSLQNFTRLRVVLRY
jgi:hypothetical protein